MRCAIYCRLSREDEDKLIESESIQNQKALLSDYAKAQGWEIAEIYCDEDYSGVDRLRPAFNRMLRDARAGCFALILCKSQSRFTRDMELVERYLHGLFPLWGIRFVAVADHVDTAIQGNKKARQINGLVNEWYLEDLSESIRMVLDHKRRKGEYIGGFPLYGYRLHPTEKGRLVIDPPAAEVVRYIFRLALDGLGKQAIAETLNAAEIPNPSLYKQRQGSSYSNGAQRDPRGLWNRSSVGRILSNEMYLGIMVQGRRKKASYKSFKLLTVPQEEWFRVEGVHEAIITPETFHAVFALRQTRRKSSATGSPHPLAGLVFCHNCGSRLHKSTDSKSNGQHSYLRCPNKDCKAACSIRLDTLLACVEERLQSYAATWYSRRPDENTEAQRQRQQCLSLAQEYTQLSARQKQRETALEQLYLDKVSGLLSVEQFTSLAETLCADLTLCRQATERCFATHALIAARLAQPAAAAEAFPSPSPPALLPVMIAKLSIEAKNRQENSQGIHILWNF